MEDEPLQKVVDNIRVEVLLEEERRVQDEIFRLQQRASMIAKAILRKYTNADS